jgi:hypothetical protein
MKPEGIDPSEVIYEIKFQSVLAVIVNRLGHEAQDLSVKDLELARDEVKSAIDHYLDEREYIEIGLDSWAIIRNL